MLWLYWFHLHISKLILLLNWTLVNIQQTAVQYLLNFDSKYFISNECLTDIKPFNVTPFRRSNPDFIKFKIIILALHRLWNVNTLAFRRLNLKIYNYSNLFNKSKIRILAVLYRNWRFLNRFFNGICN